MTRPTLLAVWLKSIGVWNVVMGIAALPMAVGYLHSYSDEQALFFMLLDTFAVPAVLFIASAYLIFGTKILVRLAYPEHEVSAQTDAEEDSARDLLRVILKAMGVWFIISGLTRLPAELSHMHRYTGSGFINVFMDTVAFAAIVVAGGCFLFFATDRCVRIAFMKTATTNDEAEEGRSNAGSEDSSSDLGKG